jgi:hypothetical protein
MDKGKHEDDESPQMPEKKSFPVLHKESQKEGTRFGLKSKVAQANQGIGPLSLCLCTRESRGKAEAEGGILMREEKGGRQ